MGNILPHEALIRGNPGAPLSNNGRYVCVPGPLGHQAANALIFIVPGVCCQWIGESAEPKDRPDVRNVDSDVGYLRAKA